MKIFFTFVFLLSVTAYADYINTNTNKCVYNLSPNFGGKGWCYTNRENGVDACSIKAEFTDFIDGFYLDGKCKMYDDLQKTGMSYSQFQFQQALLANLYGFFVFFMIGFLFVLQGRR